MLGLLGRSTSPQGSRLGQWWPLVLVGGGLLALLALPVIAGGVAFLRFYTTGEIPSAEELKIPEPSVVYDAGGNKVVTLDPAAVRKNIELENLPDHVPQATMAAEDRTFPQHPGFSIRGVTRAFFENLSSMRIEEGASTITQQYVDIAIADIPPTYVGKLREIALAYKLEQQMPKERIIEMYLNAVPLGRGAMGIEAAAQTYFRKPAAELTVNEAATLAGMISAPTRFDPVRHPTRADARRRYVLDGMVEQGWLTEREAERVKQEGLPEAVGDPLVKYGANAYYLDAVREEIARFLPDRDVFVGLKIYTELDRRLQRLALDTLRRNVEGTPYSGAVVSLDPSSGAVRALVGGLDYRKQQFNTAIQGENQPGSSFKPFGLAAFVERGYSPYETRFPAPAQKKVVFPSGQVYDIRNFGYSSFGVQTVRQATLTSTNVVYAQLAAAIEPQAVKEMAVKAGIAADDDLKAVPSLVLGTADVTVQNMAEAYSTFNNRGVHVESRLVRRVEEKDGTVVMEPGSGHTRAMSPATASVVTDILVDNIQQGTGTAARIGRPAAGKTGTTNDSRDAWFVGYVPQLTTAVWIGRLDNAPMDGITGGSIPARTWGDYMSDAVKPLPGRRFPPPDRSGLRPYRGERVVERTTQPERPAPDQRQQEEDAPQPPPQDVEPQRPQPPQRPDEPAQPPQQQPGEPRAEPGGEEPGGGERPPGGEPGGEESPPGGGSPPGEPGGGEPSEEPDDDDDGLLPL